MSNRNNLRETVINNIPEDRVAGVSNTNPIRVIDACIAQIEGRFFLIVLLRIGAGNEEVLVIRITEDQADDLMDARVPMCRILNTLPASTGGRTVTILCAFVVEDNAYLVVRIENATDELVLVRVPLCTIIGRRF